MTTKREVPAYKTTDELSLEDMLAAIHARETDAAVRTLFDGDGMTRRDIYEEDASFGEETVEEMEQRYQRGKEVLKKYSLHQPARSTAPHALLREWEDKYPAYVLLEAGWLSTRQAYEISLFKPRTT